MSRAAERPPGWRAAVRIVASRALLVVLGGLVVLTVIGATTASAIAATATPSPILVVTSGPTNQGAFIAEILRAEGLAEFTVVDIAQVDAAALAGHDLVLLAKMPLTDARVADLDAWVRAGGHLVAFAPDARLAPLLGLSPTADTLSDAFLRTDDTTRAAGGLVHASLQYHGAAALWPLAGASALALLYQDADTPTPYPAVSVNAAGTGAAAAFAYDPPTSIVQQRQGNPAWAAQERDGVTPITSDDKYYGAAAGDVHGDWVDRRRIGVPQADEQQRLLANLLTTMNGTLRPLPRFWYLPQGRAAVVVMTGDDHGNGGTSGRFDQQLALSAPGCVVAAWGCVRSTSYVYPSLPLTADQAVAYDAQGFEISLHIDTGCADFDASTLEAFYVAQLADFATRFPGLPAPLTQRHHCVAWSDWDTAARVERAHGMRLDTSAYAWPASWIDDHPGYVTGSAMPMPYMTLDGVSTGVYQAATQMTDESGQGYPATIDTLLDNALGPAAFYGALVVNAHTDYPSSAVADAVVASAQARGVAVVSARQLLAWLDGRNGSNFSNVAWDGSRLTFTVQAGAGAAGLQAMVPIAWNGALLAGLARAGVGVPWSTRSFKGIDYAAFAADAGGPYVARYAADALAPKVVAAAPVAGGTGVDTSVHPAVTFSEAMDPSTLTSATVQLRDPLGALVPASLTYDPATRTATLSPPGALLAGATYTVSVAGGTADPAARDLAGHPIGSYAKRFTTTAGASTGTGCPCRLWPDGAVPVQASAADAQSVVLGVRFEADANGYVTGVRFYKGAANTGPHVADLWNADGTHLASAAFVDETATGWQTAVFDAPVPVTAGSIYVASYLAPAGGYAQDEAFFADRAVDAPPLHAPADGTGNHNGVFVYAGASAFPSESYRASNYWVDVVFVTSLVADPGPPAVTAPSPAAGATGVARTATVLAPFNEAMDASTISSTTFQLTDATGHRVTAVVSYDASTRTATLKPANALKRNMTYTALVKGGASGAVVKDLLGRPMPASVTWRFTTQP